MFSLFSRTFRFGFALSIDFAEISDTKTSRSHFSSASHQLLLARIGTRIALRPLRIGSTVSRRYCTGTGSLAQSLDTVSGNKDRQAHQRNNERRAHHNETLLFGFAIDTDDQLCQVLPFIDTHRYGNFILSIFNHSEY